MELFSLMLYLFNEVEILLGRKNETEKKVSKIYLSHGFDIYFTGLEEDYLIIYLAYFIKKKWNYIFSHFHLLQDILQRFSLNYKPLYIYYNDW